MRKPCRKIPFGNQSKMRLTNIANRNREDHYHHTLTHYLMFFLKLIKMSCVSANLGENGVVISNTTEQ